ncbi:MAG: 16S rRNA (cytosine(1402)-N(4))-methyltransferase RsmH [Calditrichaeota bacterium]|nr:MAG: 16S rRNA (cytosine(1402)-N(4))-methyltransferase RsmH [Calditrichota bacterium]
MSQGRVDKLQDQREKASSDYHDPVMVAEVMQYLVGDLNGTYIDATLGGAGHTSVLLNQLSEEAVVIGLDRDADAHRAAAKRIGNDSRFIAVHGAFSEIASFADEHSIRGCDGILADLGVSSYQLDTAERGFSFMKEGPLDLRMNRDGGQTVAELLSGVDEKDLADIIYKFGEERKSRHIARVIVRERKINPIHMTQDLVRLLDAHLPAKNRIKSIARVFQALRIYVNDELGQLETFLRTSFDLLNSGGRLVVLTYHSLEDRLTKQFIAEKTRGCICPKEIPVCVCGHEPEGKSLIRKVITAQSDEVQRNPRARSAKLRAIEKI